MKRVIKWPPEGLPVGLTVLLGKGLAPCQRIIIHSSALEFSCVRIFEIHSFSCGDFGFNFKSDWDRKFMHFNPQPHSPCVTGQKKKISVKEYDLTDRFSMAVT